MSPRSLSLLGSGPPCWPAQSDKVCLPSGTRDCSLNTESELQILWWWSNSCRSESASLLPTALFFFLLLGCTFVLKGEKKVHIWMKPCEFNVISWWLMRLFSLMAKKCQLIGLHFPKRHSPSDKQCSFFFSFRGNTEKKTQWCSLLLFLTWRLTHGGYTGSFMFYAPPSSSPL